MTDHLAESDVVVVGGGLAGLAAAALSRAAAAGDRVREGTELGGRAATHAAGDFRLNLGPHALYRGGPARPCCASSGWRFTGGMPAPSGAYAIDRGAQHALPGGLVSLLTTGLFGLPAKMETARLLAGLARIDPEPLQRHLACAPGSTATCGTGRAPPGRGAVPSLDLRQRAGAPERRLAVRQLQLALAHDVRYLDGGWQTLVDGLRAAPRSRRAYRHRRPRSPPSSATTAARGVRLADGTSLPARAVIVAVGPAAAARAARGRRPAGVRAPGPMPRSRCGPPASTSASRVCRGRAPRFALGIDEPLYLLGPLGGGAARARGRRDDPRRASTWPTTRQRSGRRRASSSKALLDLLQPGWRDVVVERRFLPDMMVSQRARHRGGRRDRGRPGPAVPGVREPLPRRRLGRRRGLARRRQPGERAPPRRARAGAPRPRRARRRDATGCARVRTSAA